MQALKQTITSEQKEIILKWLEQDKLIIMHYYLMLLDDINKKNQLYFIEYFTEYSTLYRLVSIDDSTHVLLCAMYDAIMKNIYRDTPLLSVKELKKLHGLA